MFNIFEQYGIKEVANVYFEALANDAEANVYAGDIVLFLDSLKVSTIEASAETADARGGWGNPRLVTWDYGKEITVTLEDALISFESLRFMLGGAIKYPSAQDSVEIRHTEEYAYGSSGIRIPDGTVIKASAGHPIRLINLTKGLRTQIAYDSTAAENTYTIKDGTVINFKNDAMGQSSSATPAEGDTIRIFWTEIVTSNTGDSTVEVTISPNTFPGSYRIVGDTFIRNASTGKDEMFQFVIGKAKVTSNVTFTLQAEGDPATFSMTLNVERSKSEDAKNEMMKLIRYTNAGTGTSISGDDKGSVTNQS